jgi:arginine decarboxylase
VLQPAPTGGTVEDDPQRSEWSAAESAALYSISGWGHPYFHVNDAGRVEVRPDPRRDRRIDLYELVCDLKERGLDLPLLIRFSDVIGDRVRRLNEAFRSAISEYDYAGDYRGVYPVKVNQQRHVVEEIVGHGAAWGYGLEAGSKPELLIALAQMQRPGGLIVCNGYKDASYIETALLAQSCEKTVVIVLERRGELDMVFRASEKLGIRPMLGVRAKLSTRSVGRWAGSVGDRAKFGLTAAEIVEVVDTVSDRGMLDCLQLLHFHVGSQISNILPLKKALREAAHFYVELARMGCAMGYLDVGGGLAIDYDGSRSDGPASKNYGLQEYASDVVWTVREACNRASLEPPTLITESGRAVVAHQSVLIFDVVDTSTVRISDPGEAQPDDPSFVRELYHVLDTLSPRTVQEAWHDISQARDEAQSLFKHGYLSLRERARAERLYWCCCDRIASMMEALPQVPDELADLERVLASIYYCNFSVFQSAPDMWAIDQLFPIMPIHRLDEEPDERAILADLTCDSDGVVDRFIDPQEDEKRVLEVHAPRPGEPYYMGMFLCGAYQEILGDLHNLFGDTNAVHVGLSEPDYTVAHVVRGDRVDEVLRYVQYDAEEMEERVRRQAEQAMKRGRMTRPQLRLLMRHYADSLRAYTYLSDGGDG